MKRTTMGYSDSQTDGKTVTIPDLAYAADFAVASEAPGCTVLSNLSTPLDQAETIRFQIQDVANIYNGSGVDPTFYASSKKGFSLLVQVNDVARVTSDEDTSFQVDLPVSAHLVIKAPKSQYVTADILRDAALRAVSLLFATGSTGTERISSLVRGAMTPPLM